MAAIDDLIIIAPVEFRPSDTATVDDAITWELTRVLDDEIATVDDIIIIAPANFVSLDSSVVDDAIGFTVTKPFGDDATVEDSIIWTLTRVLDDEIASIDDLIVIAPVTFRPSDTATVDDSIRWTVIKVLDDEIATVDDSIDTLGAINIETRDELSNLVGPGLTTTYRVIPNPFTGTGTLLVTDNGGFDNDGALDGQINLFPVPFGIYQINQTTIVPNTHFSVINFTFATVHSTDINATALFRVFDKTTNPADLDTTPSDILDIADNRFDEIVLSSQLANVLTGIETPIVATTDMSGPVFVGANDQGKVQTAVDAQSTLLYKNVVLTPNDIPENIRNAFVLAPYDAGNFTGTTMVGVLSATEESTVYGQYLATTPFDQFNCGQQYVFGLDDTLIPTFGGLSGFNLTINAFLMFSGISFGVNTTFL